MITFFILSLITAILLPVSQVQAENEAGYETVLALLAKPHYKASYSKTGLVVTQQASEITNIEATDAQHSGQWTQSVISAAAKNGKPHMLDNNSLIQVTATPIPSYLKPSTSKTGVSGNGSEQLKVYRYEQASGVMVFADHAPGSNDYQVLLYDCYACRPDSDLDWHRMPLFSHDYDELIGQAAKRHKLDPALIRAVIHAESAFNVFALSRTGAMGLMQLMPETAKELGVINAFKPDQNIDGGAKYLAQMLKRFDGDIELACAAYNAGPSTVIHYKGIPPYPETQAYVKRVKILLQRYRKS
ncbi:lytic transglycosylase domain-containing protein [Shewanella benthica]|uniref:lytic transglycosylase domain-containing protein n=1 Tax=Shewanella benthica TaxID=43661 RepID=UPI00058D3596|nr:lytic transglycosylase domain-containing protein [Shewanella benthica]